MACIHYRAGCTRSYISGSSGPRRRGELWYMRKSEKDKRIPVERKGARICVVQRLSRGYSSLRFRSRVLSRTAYIVSSVYEARFKPFTLAFTLLTSLRLRSLRMSLATTSRRPPPLRYRDQRASPRVKGRNPSFLSFLSPFPLPSFHTNPSPLSLNPRYPRADHLGNLSSCVDDIADPD